MSTTVMQAPQLSTGRLLLLGASSVILCISTIMAIFAPFPLALAIIMYGRMKGYFIGVAGLLTTFAFAMTKFGSLTLFGFYGCVFLIGAGVAEIVRRGISPVKGLVVFGLALVLLAAGGFAYSMNSLNTTPKEFIIQQLAGSADKLAEQKKALELEGGKDTLEVLHILDNPELMADEMIQSFPSYFFMGVFIMLWFNMFLTLKSRRLLFSGNDYQYSEKNLLNFQVPFGFVLVLVAGLVLAIWGAQLGTLLPYETIGMTIIKCLGVFYFFQGFGVFTDLLNFVGVTGFFRTLLVMITIFMGAWLIAVAGLFDNWFEFRKYFVKRKTED